MKKVLSFALAVLMVMGITSTAFAANPSSDDWDISGADGINFAEDVIPGYKVRLYLHDGVGAGAPAVPRAAMVNIASATVGANLEQYTVTGTNATPFIAALTLLPSSSNPGWAAGVITLDTTNSDDIALMNLLNTQSSTIATNVANTSTTATTYNGVITVTAYVPATAPPNYLTKADITLNKYTAQVKVAGSNTYIKSTSPTIKYTSTNVGTLPAPGAAYIEIEFVDPFVSTSSKDFELTAYLRANKSQTGIEYVMSGTFANLNQTVDEGDDYVYGVDYRVITANANIKKIEVELDYGLTITTRMVDGRRYYGHVSTDPTTADEAIMDKYPTIEEVYNLKTIGLNPTGDVVRFDDDSMFAYTLDANGDLVYLGKTAAALPYFTKYFLSTKALDLPEEAEEPVEDVIGPDTDNAVTGGDDVVVANANDNPGTGC